MKPYQSCRWVADNGKGVACQNCQRPCECDGLTEGKSCREVKEHEEKKYEDDFPYLIDDWPRPVESCGWGSNTKHTNKPKCSVCQKDFMKDKPCDCYSSVIRGDIKGKNCIMKPDQNNSSTSSSNTEARTVKLKISSTETSVVESEERLPCAKLTKKGRNCMVCGIKPGKGITFQEDKDNDECESLGHEEKFKKSEKTEKENQGFCSWYSQNKDGKVCIACDTNPKPEEEKTITGNRFAPPCSWLSKSSTKGRQCSVCASGCAIKKKKK